MAKHFLTNFNIVMIVIVLAIVAVAIWSLIDINHDVKLPHITHLNRETEHYNDFSNEEIFKNDISFKPNYILCPSVQVLSNPEQFIDINTKMKNYPYAIMPVYEAKSLCYNYESCKGFYASYVDNDYTRAKIIFIDSNTPSFVKSSNPSDRVYIKQLHSNDCLSLKQYYYHMKTNPDPTEQVILQDYNNISGPITKQKAQDLCTLLPNDICQGFTCKKDVDNLNICSNPKFLSKVSTGYSSDKVSFDILDGRKIINTSGIDTIQYEKRHNPNSMNKEDLLSSSIKGIRKSLLNNPRVPKNMRIESGDEQRNLKGISFSDKMPTRNCKGILDSSCILTNDIMTNLGRPSSSGQDDDMYILDGASQMYKKQKEYCCNYSSNRQIGIPVSDNEMRLDKCDPSNLSKFFDENCNAVCRNQIDKENKQYTIYRKDLKQCVSEKVKCFPTHESCNQDDTIISGRFKDGCPGYCPTNCERADSLYPSGSSRNLRNPSRNCVADGSVYYANIGNITDFDTGIEELKNFLQTTNVIAISVNSYAQEEKIDSISNINISNTNIFSGTLDNEPNDTAKIQKIIFSRYFDFTKELLVFYNDIEIRYVLRLS